MEEGHRGALRRRAVASNATGDGEEVAVDEQERELLGHSAAAGGDRGVTDSNSCCIFHEPWTSSGGHRICCIPCGHVYGRSCLELWLARSRGTAAKCLFCGKRFSRGDKINLYGATEHLLDHCQQEQQVATEEEQEEEEEAERQVLAAPDDEQQLVVAPAIMDAIARMNQGVSAPARRDNEVPAGGGWRDGAVAWKGVEVAWRIEAAAVDLVGNGGEVALGRVILLPGGIILVFVVCVVLCFIF